MSDSVIKPPDVLRGLDPSCLEGEDRSPMAEGTTGDRRRIWWVVLGAVAGVALGILVSVTTDVPFAPEAGLVLGGLVGWFASADRRR
jgi:hypothetical protein